MVNTNGVTGLEQDAGDEPGGSGLAPSAMRGRGRWGRREMAAPGGRLRLRPRPQGLCGRPCKGTPPTPEGDGACGQPRPPPGYPAPGFCALSPPHAGKSPPRVPAASGPRRAMPAVGSRGQGCPAWAPPRPGALWCGAAARSLSAFQRLTLRCEIIHPEDNVEASPWH